MVSINVYIRYQQIQGLRLRLRLTSITSTSLRCNHYLNLEVNRDREPHFLRCRLSQSRRRSQHRLEPEDAFAALRCE